MADSLLLDSMDISKLKVPDLKRELKTRGLSASGNKTELMERLQSALDKSKSEDTGTGESLDDLEDEDLLNDDDLDQDPLDASESVLTDLDADLELMPSKPLKRKSSESDTASRESEHKSIQKVVLNRTPSVLEEVEKAENGIDLSIDLPDDNNDASPPDKKVVKLSHLTAKERLDMRAKKFGLPLSDDAKKVVRAERFNASVKAGTIATSTVSAPGAEVLKKRAERFGGSVSTAMSSIEQQERLEKRKKRFGASKAANGSTTQSDKAQQRLERFKVQPP